MDRSSFLRKALLGNAAFSALCGLDMLFLTDTLSRFLGLSDPRVLRELGASLLLFALGLAIAATRRRIRPLVASLFTAMDIGWVAGTAALLISRPQYLHATGVTAAIVVADVVAAFAVLQIIGIRRLTRHGRQGDDGRSLESLSPVARAS